MGIAILLKDNGINEANSQGLVQSHLAGIGVSHSWSSSSKILTTRVWRKKFHLKVACRNVSYKKDLAHLATKENIA